MNEEDDGGKEAVHQDFFNETRWATPPPLKTLGGTPSAANSLQSINTAEKKHDTVVSDNDALSPTHVKKMLSTTQDGSNGALSTSTGVKKKGKLGAKKTVASFDQVEQQAKAEALRYQPPVVQPVEV